LAIGATSGNLPTIRFATGAYFLTPETSFTAFPPGIKSTAIIAISIATFAAVAISTALFSSSSILFSTSGITKTFPRTARHFIHYWSSMS